MKFGCNDYLKRTYEMFNDTDGQDRNDGVEQLTLYYMYGRGTSPRQDTSSRHPAYKLAFCAQGRNNLRAGLSTIAQQAQRFDLPLRNEVKTGKKLLKIVWFLQLNFFNFCDSTNFSYNAP